MHNSWVSLLPALIVIIAIFITKKINQSLFVGILTAALIATDFYPILAGKLAFTRGLEVFDLDTVLLYIFLFILGAIITLMAKTGGAYAFAHHIAEKKPSKKATEYYSMLISTLLSIDDYLSTLTVGYVMRPLTDHVRIPRAKLAFLVHAMADGLIMLVPISSWVTALTSTLSQAGITDTGSGIKISADPFLLYVQTIPFIFYGFLIVLCVAFLIKTQLAFGPMAHHESVAQSYGNLYGSKESPGETIQTEAHMDSLADLILPLSLLLGIILIGSLWMGDYFLFGGSHGFLDAIKNNTQQDRSIIMCIAGAFSFGLSWLFAAQRKKISKTSIPSLFIGSYKLMVPALILITLANILGKLLASDLQAGAYLANLLLGTLPLFILPLVLFLVALFLAAITSAFGSMMILIPIMVPTTIILSGTIAPTTLSAVPLLLPVLGAIFSGAICGNQISPMSDTTIMVSTSTGIEPAEHAKTQFPYALIAIVGSAISFFVAGVLNTTEYWIKVGISLGTGIITCLLLLYGIAFIYKRRS
jgi:Na+/H+ antiporter NhaC